MLTELLDRVLELLGADTAAVLLVDESGEELSPRRARHRGGGPAGRPRPGRLRVRRAHRRRATADRARPGRRVDGLEPHPVAEGHPHDGRRAADQQRLRRGCAPRRLPGLASVRRRRHPAAADRGRSACQRRARPAARGRQGGCRGAATEPRSERAAPNRRSSSPLGTFRPRAAASAAIGTTCSSSTTETSGSSSVTWPATACTRRSSWVGIRSALRSYALLSSSPDEALALTDRKVQHFEVGTMATVAVGVISPPYDEMHVALAGHPPPVVATPMRPAEIANIRAGPPLGVDLAATAPWPRCRCRRAQWSCCTPTGSSNGVASSSTKGSTACGRRWSPGRPPPSATG